MLRGGTRGRPDDALRDHGGAHGSHDASGARRHLDEVQAVQVGLLVVVLVVVGSHCGGGGGGGE